jgi:hypothetical protein
MMQAQIDVATKDHSAVGAQALDHGEAEGTDPSNRRDADGKAGEEDAKAVKAGAQFASG